MSIVDRSTVVPGGDTQQQRRHDLCQSTALFFLMGRSLDELTTDVDSFCNHDAIKMVRMLRLRAAKPGGVEGYLRAILEMQRRIAKMPLYLAGSRERRGSTRAACEVLKNNPSRISIEAIEATRLPAITPGPKHAAATQRL